MSGVYLFGLTARNAEWLTNRQTIVAENIANVDTPGFKSKDIQAFSDVMDSTRLEMAGTDRLHMTGGSGRPNGVEEDRATSWDTTHSGNTVSLEQELMKSGEISRNYGLNTSITKAFHKMFLTTLRG